MDEDESLVPKHDVGQVRVPHVIVGGVRVAVISRREIVDLMLREAPEVARQSGARARTVVDSNAHCLSMAASDPTFRDAVARADIVHADGGIIVAASRVFSGAAIPNRSCTTDMYLESLPGAAATGVRYFLLGGKKTVAAACAERSVDLAPGLTIVGYHHGYYRADEEDAVVDVVNAAAPDVLWVGLGKPQEQLFCDRNRQRIKAGWIVTCGGLFNYITGDYPRAPLWMRQSGMEWLHRMATNPRQLLWRYVTTNPHALWLIIARRSRRVIYG